MKWRYQLVGEADHAGITYSLCEVYLDADGRLERWSEPEEPCVGDSPAETRQELIHMLLDASRWQAVMVEDLHAGMKFERALTLDQNAELEKLTGALSHAFGERDYEKS